MSSRIRSGNIDAHTSTTGYTPLHIAAKFGQGEAVRQLLVARARVDLRDVLGQTPLALACCYNVGTDIPRQLLQAEADPDHQDKYTWTPLFWAAYRGFYDVVKLLVDQGADKNAKDKRWKRPYDWASTQQIKTLLD